MGNVNLYGYYCGLRHIALQLALNVWKRGRGPVKGKEITGMRKDAAFCDAICLTLI